jgi:hypothetical protein
MLVVTTAVIAIGRTFSSINELAFDDIESERLINGGDINLPMVLGGVGLKE